MKPIHLYVGGAVISLVSLLFGNVEFVSYVFREPVSEFFASDSGGNTKSKKHYVNTPVTPIPVLGADVRCFLDKQILSPGMNPNDLLTTNEWDDLEESYLINRKEYVRRYYYPYDIKSVNRGVKIHRATLVAVPEIIAHDAAKTGFIILAEIYGKTP